MYALHVIHQINAKAAKAPKVEDSSRRHCSYAESRAGIVLHSAKLRSTAFLDGRRTKCFLAAWFGTNSQVQRDALVESYFRTIPTGKQRLAA